MGPSILQLTSVQRREPASQVGKPPSLIAKLLSLALGSEPLLTLMDELPHGPVTDRVLGAGAAGRGAARVQAARGEFVNRAPILPDRYGTNPRAVSLCWFTCTLSTRIVCSPSTKNHDASTTS